MISVVMAVYNGAAHLQATLDNIFAQTFTDFELIVVDDGSSDATPAVLRSAPDPRLRVITQENRGLTHALIRGCSEARGEFIARHDSGDRSRPDRLTKQMAAFGKGVVLVSCYTSYRGPGGEPLYVSEGDGEAVRQSLLHDGVERIRGLSHHGSAMFRRDTYVAAGGYRPQFRFAQDLDLWVRMAALGEIVFVPEVLYEATVDEHAISSRNRAEQIESARIAVQLRDIATGRVVWASGLPRDGAGGRPEAHTTPANVDALLQRAAAIGPAQRRNVRRAEADSLYFIASCLSRRSDRRWVGYARRALRRNPLLLRAWLLFLRWHR